MLYACKWSPQIQWYRRAAAVAATAAAPVSVSRAHVLHASASTNLHYWYWCRAIARLVFVMVHLPGVLNMADILTKAQSVSVFNQLMTAYDAFVTADTRIE